MKPRHHTEELTVNEFRRYVAKMATLIFVFVLINLCFVIYAYWDAKIDRKAIMAGTADARAEAKVVAREQFEFISRTTQRWETLAAKNPQLEVPRVSEPQPLGKVKLSEEELQRPPHEKPKPTLPIVIKKTTIKKYYPKPTPTPFKWPWSKTTR